jgi:hypothetical protein
LSRRQSFCSPLSAVLRPSLRPVSAPSCSTWSTLRFFPLTRAPGSLGRRRRRPLYARGQRKG